MGKLAKILKYLARVLKYGAKVARRMAKLEEIIRKSNNYFNAAINLGNRYAKLRMAATEGSDSWRRYMEIERRIAIKAEEHRRRLKNARQRLNNLKAKLPETTNLDDLFL